MEEVCQFKLRIESCVNTVIDVHNFLGSERMSPEMVEQFQKLKEVVSILNMNKVAEQDIEKIELATNNLLDELRVLFKFREVGPIYCGFIH